MIFQPGKIYGLSGEGHILVRSANGNTKFLLRPQEQFLCLGFAAFDGEQVATECVWLFAHFGEGYIVRVVDKSFGFDSFNVWRLIEEL